MMMHVSVRYVITVSLSPVISIAS